MMNWLHLFQSAENAGPISFSGQAEGASYTACVYRLVHRGPDGGIHAQSNSSYVWRTILGPHHFPIQNIPHEERAISLSCHADLEQRVEIWMGRGIGR